MQHDTSDVDLLIDMMPGGSLLDLVNMQMELSKEIGVQFDVNTPRSLPKKWRDTVVQGAVAL
jgi:predicted nucleotidyltransferase